MPAVKAHHRALPWAEVGEALDAVRSVPGISECSRLCLEFLVLTAARNGEALGAAWDEIVFGLQPSPRKPVDRGRLGGDSSNRHRKGVETGCARGVSPRPRSPLHARRVPSSRYRGSTRRPSRASLPIARARAPGSRNAVRRQEAKTAGEGHGEPFHDRPPERAIDPEHRHPVPVAADRDLLRTAVGEGCDPGHRTGAPGSGTGILIIAHRAPPPMRQAVCRVS